MDHTKPTLSSGRVLVLDGETRAALAVIRSLHRRKLQIAVAAHRQQALCFSSNACGTQFLCPDPGYAPDMYQKWLLEVVEHWQPEMLFAASDLSLKLALRIEHQLRSRTILPTVDQQTFEEVSDKHALLNAASGLGIAVPATLLIPAGGTTRPEVREAIRRFPFPAVLKLNSSVSDLRSHFVKASTVYAEAPEQVIARISDNASPLAHAPCLLQEQIFGAGVGVFALCSQGKPLALFAHRRILEKPPSGGRSVLSESIPLEAAPVDEALALLAHYRWNGVAMVEFKQQSSGTCCLMEINPRFWGSLQLAVDCGRDFPGLLYELYREGDPPTPAALRAAVPTEDYAVGRRLRWLLGTVDHLLIRLRRAPLATLRAVLKNNELQLWTERRRTRLEVCRTDDPGPFLGELKGYMLSLLFGNPAE